MPLFFIRENFQHKGRVYRTNEMGDATLEVSNAHLAEELKLGTHPTSKKPLSGLLNHCVPADDATRALVDPEFAKEYNKKSKAEIEAEKQEAATDKKAAEMDAKEAIYAEFDEMGKAYNRSWGLKRLKDELIKAKKATGK